MNKTITCPHCGQQNEVANAELYEGKKIRIPCGNRNCGQKFEILFESIPEPDVTEISAKNVYGRMAVLILTENEYHKESIYMLEKGEQIFGRKSNISKTSGQLESSDKTISRRHFKITGIKEKRSENIKFILEDLQSINSLFINGLELKSNFKPVLQHNDEIGIGNSELVFKYTDREG